MGPNVNELADGALKLMLRLVMFVMLPTDDISMLALPPQKAHGLETAPLFVYVLAAASFAVTVNIVPAGNDVVITMI